MNLFSHDEINLLEAAQDGKLEFINNQLTSLTSRHLQQACKKTDYYGRNALHYVHELLQQAAYRGHYKVVEYFLDLQCININSQDNKGNTALMLTCVRGYNTDINTLKEGQKFAICSLLIERGASVEQYKKLGINNPLHWACFFGDLKTAKLLMYIEPSLMLFTNDRDQFPIDLSLMTGKELDDREEDERVLEYMIMKFLAQYLDNEEHRKKLDVFDEEYEAFKNLHKHNLNLKSTQQLTQVGLRYLFWASTQGRLDLVRPLLKCKYSPFEPSYRGRNALHAAVYHNRLELVQFYLESDESRIFRKENVINLMTKDKPQTALHIAVERGHIEIAKILIKKGADPNYYNFRNHRAFDQSRLNEIKQLKRELLHNDEKNYLRSGYNHILVGWQKSKNQLLEQQFNNIQIKKNIEKGQFKYISYESIDKQYTYYCLKVDERLKNVVADQNKMMIYNSREGYLSPFNLNIQEQFENFHHIHNQQILLTLLYDEFDIEQFISDGLLLEQFPLHDEEEKELIIKFWKNERINILFEPFQLRKSTSRTFSALSTYFGPEVGMFFVFLCFFSTWLFLPAIPGLILGIISYFDEEAIQAIAPIYTLCMAVWATIFFEFWKRKQSETMYNFDMHVAKEQRRTIPQYKGSFIIEDVTHTIEIMDTRNVQWKYFKSNTPLVLLALVFIAGQQTGYYYLKQVYEDDDFYQTLWACLLALTVLITNEIFNFFSKHTLIYENHQFQDERENVYILKVFAFTFLNSFGRLFYRSIIKPDEVELKLFSISFTITWSLIHLIRYTIYPWISFSFIKLKFNWDFNKQKQLNNNKQINTQQKIGDTETSGMNKSFDKGISTQYFLQQIELNKRMIDPPDHVEQFTYFMTQFCMVTMFSAGSQIIPIIALFFNLLNIEGLLYGFRKFVKRPLAEPKKNIGVWNDILQLIGYIGIVSNCLTIYQANQQELNKLVGANENSDQDQTNLGLRNFLLLIVAEHIVIGIKFVIEGVIPDEPEWVELVLKKEEYLSEQNKSNIKKNDSIKPLENKVKQD
ncbi:unnamed protein product (macronuclear) [Paramecium tetraurelia]|uniref:Anoctamin transmembrane domain-containing protein n=1 Tax=Paramecium tetraurelia TaxID=5888 RepID=A0CMD7_PARTE|nr:uncharacterized protein GSPATT00008433001 [Paramecium tetraurelia]CAK71954.1 unnamed protein product [Paramecium tetraurelia]|eukprot:XP_001439351.1 hypothetical protein (macronuclear) [Paramecium tetraurelia strain d4-2]